MQSFIPQILWIVFQAANKQLLTPVNESNQIRIASVAELDALIGVHVTGETPEVMWEDSHGHFQFETEAEALIAIADPYYQQFLPDVDWSMTVVRQVRIYRRYSSDPFVLWSVVEKATAAHGVLQVWREMGLWCATFGSNPSATARNPAVAICLAALHACKLKFDVNQDRIDSQINQIAAMPSLGVSPSN